VDNGGQRRESQGLEAVVPFPALIRGGRGKAPSDQGRELLHFLGIRTKPLRRRRSGVCVKEYGFSVVVGKGVVV